mmetsp:Transcript_68318/g.189794  ORF Transcript_68318/g.189794 Transcript_68318/m.189794 type:complete len:123 (-) Transcript_68318:851-1219(-)
MRRGTSRDKRRQSRLLRGNKDGFEICTVDHLNGGAVRLDATISYTDSNHEVGVYAHEHEDLQTDNFMKVYSPTQGDECYITLDSDGNIDAVEGPWLFQTKNELRHCNTLFKPSTSGSAPQGV